MQTINSAMKTGGVRAEEWRGLAGGEKEGHR